MVEIPARWPCSVWECFPEELSQILMVASAATGTKYIDSLADVLYHCSAYGRDEWRKIGTIMMMVRDEECSRRTTDSS